MSRAMKAILCLFIIVVMFGYIVGIVYVNNTLKSTEKNLKKDLRVIYTAKEEFAVQRRLLEEENKDLESQIKLRMSETTSNEKKSKSESVISGSYSPRETTPAPVTGAS